MADSEYRRTQRVDPDSDIYASGYDPMAEQLKAEGVFKGPDGRDWVVVDPSMVNGTYQLQQYESGNAAGHRNMIMSNAQPVGPGGALAVPRDIVNQSIVANGMWMSPPQKTPGLAALSIGGIIGGGLLAGGGLPGAGAAGADVAGAAGGFGAETGLGTWSALPTAAETAANSAWLTGPTSLTGATATGTATSLADLFNTTNPLGDWTFDPTLGDPGALPGGFQTVTPPTTPTAPFQPGFNLLDPSTYGGSAAQSLLQRVTGPAKTALQRILDGNGSASDYASVLGTVGQTALGMFAGNQQANKAEDLAKQVLEFGTPSRLRYEASFDPSFNIWDRPENKALLDTTWEAGLRKASAGSGNPITNPGVMAELNKYITGSVGVPLMQNYRAINKDAGFGTVTPYANLQTNAINQEGGMWEALGGGLERLITPQQPRYTLNLGQFGVV